MTPGEPLAFEGKPLGEPGVVSRRHVITFCSPASVLVKDDLAKERP